MRMFPRSRSPLSSGTTHEKNRIGDSAFDSVESLMQAIESHLAAKRPKPLTEEDVRAMLWGRSGRDVTIGSEKLFTTPEESGIHDALIAINNHNAIVDRL